MTVALMISFKLGDFNCTENVIDRNHVKPHMQSRKRLIQLIKSHSIVDTVYGEISMAHRDNI